MKAGKPNIPRHQHYVPMVYLNNFAIQKRKSYFVTVYDLKSKRIYPVNTKNICGERDLYTLDSEHHPNPLVIEQNVYASSIEPMYKEAYRLLTDDNITTISDIQRRQILVGVYQFYFRNPKLLNDVISFQFPAIKQAYNEAKEKGEKQFAFLEEEYSIENKSCEDILNRFSDSMKYIFKTVHVEQFKDLVKTRAFDSINVCKIVDDSYFISSDNPFPHFSISNLGSRNPFSSDMLFYLPLNGKYCLCLKSDKTKERNRIYRQEVDYLFSLPINKIIISNTKRFIIGSEKAIEDITVYYTELFSSEVEATRQFISFIKDVYERYVEVIAGLECLKPYFTEYEQTGSLSQEKFKEMAYKYAEVVKGALLENTK